MNSPAELLITDARGRKTGYDPRTHQSFDDIPGVVYWVEWPIENIADPNQNDPMERSQLRKVAYINPGLEGNLSFEIIGTDEGTGYFLIEGRNAYNELKVFDEHVFQLTTGSSETVHIDLPVRVDFDMNGVVDMSDFLFFQHEWLQSGTRMASDVYPDDGDDFVDLNDLAVLAEHWLK